MEINLNNKPKDNLIGTHVRYFDYLGLERFGVIIASEPYIHDNTVMYVYIEDEEPEFNIHEDIVNNQSIKYADIRLTSEINVI